MDAGKADDHRKLLLIGLTNGVDYSTFFASLMLAVGTHDDTSTLALYLLALAGPYDHVKSNE